MVREMLMDIGNLKKLEVLSSFMLTKVASPISSSYGTQPTWKILNFRAAKYPQFLGCIVGKFEK